MKLGLTAKALVLAVAVGVSSQAMASTTNGWWNIDFEDATTITALTNEAFSAFGQWTTAEGDESTIVTNEAGNSSVYLKLDTQGTDVVWTPSVASTTSVVLVNANVFLVGSDSEPTGFDTEAAGTPVQSAIYLKNYVNAENETTHSALCAYVGVTESSNAWIELIGPEMTDTNWYTLKIEVDYTETIPVARFYVGDTQMVDASDADAFTIANYTEFSQPDKKQVNSVSFRGTGAVDNFVGQQVAPDVAAELQFIVDTYTNEIKDGVSNTAGASTGLKVTAGNEFFVSFFQFDDADEGTNALSLVRVYTSGSTVTNDYVVSFDDPGWTYAPPLFYDAGTYGVRLNIDTTGFEVGQTIEAYYGTHPTVIDPPAGDPTVPSIGGGDIGETAPVGFEMIGDPEEEYFTVSFVAPEAGIVYTLQTAATLGAVFADAENAEATATSIDTETVITLKAPTGGATAMFFRVKAAVPVAE